MRFLIGLSAVSLLLAAVSFTPAQDKQDGFQPLFNGKDLTNFYTFIKKFGKNEDPEKVFTVHDGTIHVSGKLYGYFSTEKEYANYHLRVEFKWGEQTWSPREKRARDSGILLHGVGKDGSAGRTWMESIECQMIEGGTGDIILIKGKNAPTLTAEVENGCYKPGGEPRTYKGNARINWSGRSRKWRDVKGFRGENDVEKPVGQWNIVECICAGDKLTIILNGQVVNVGTKASHTKGKILFQSEGAEVFFRKVEIKLLK